LSRISCLACSEVLQLLMVIAHTLGVGHRAGA